MDIDSDNFTTAIVNDVAAALQSCEYLSIDLEMSGISFSDERSTSSTDSVPFRYAKGREVAENFGIIQLGLAVFGSNSFAWNFHVFPRPISEGAVKHTPTVALCSAGVNFGRATGINFQRWIDKGISFVDRNVEAALEDANRQEADSMESSWNRYLSAPGSWQDVSSDIMQREIDAIRAFVADENRVEYKLPNMRTMAALRALLQSIHSEIVLAGFHLEIMEQTSGAATDRYLTKKSKHEIFLDRLGFRRIWKLIIESGKPLILHNGLLDLLFCYQWFEAPLPADISDFRSSLRQLFPGGVFDTRLIALESGIAANGSSLEALTEQFSNDTGYKSVKLPDMLARKYATGQFHEAAYDAYTTGAVFRALLGRLGDAVQSWKDVVCVARCYWCFGLLEDRLMKEKDKLKSVRYLTGLNAGVSTRDLLAVFEELKNVREPVGVTSVVTSFSVNSFFVDWVDDASALLVVSWAFEGDKDAASIGLTARLQETAKTAGFRLAALDEFVQRQCEISDNRFSSEPIELQGILKRIKLLVDK